MAKLLDIDENRIIIHEYQKINDSYYGIFNQIDILLDTMPYSGTTTTCDSLYMSTPIITRYNKDYHVQNVTASILNSIGHEELVSYSDSEYIEKTIALINDISRINNYKTSLRTEFLNKQNPIDFTRKFENLLVSSI